MSVPTPEKLECYIVPGFESWTSRLRAGRLPLDNHHGLIPFYFFLEQEGDKVSAGDVLCEIQTDKAVVSMEIDDDAIVAKILVPEGTAGVKVISRIQMFCSNGLDLF